MAKARETILVVEPLDSLRELVSRELQANGFEVVAAASGRSGLVELRSCSPLLAFVEWALPDITGTAFEIEIRSDSATRQAPIIFTAGWKARDRIVFEVVSSKMGKRVEDGVFVSLIQSIDGITRNVARAAETHARRAKS